MWPFARIDHFRTIYKRVPSLFYTSSSRDKAQGNDALALQKTHASVALRESISSLEIVETRELKNAKCKSRASQQWLKNAQNSEIKWASESSN